MQPVKENEKRGKREVQMNTVKKTSKKKNANNNSMYRNKSNIN